MDSNGARDDSRLGSGYFECLACNHRVWSDDRIANCPNCGSPTANISVARE